MDEHGNLNSTDEELLKQVEELEDPQAAYHLGLSYFGFGLYNKAIYYLSFAHLRGFGPARQYLDRIVSLRERFKPRDDRNSIFRG